MGACNCCQKPFCPSPGLRGDASVSSKSAPVCYFNPFVANPDKKFKKRVIVTEIDNSGNARLDSHLDGVSPDYFDSYSNFTKSEKVESLDYSPGCAEPISSCDGPGKATFHCEFDSTARNEEEVPYASGSSDKININSCTGEGTWVVDYPGGTASYPDGVCLERFGRSNCTSTPTSLALPDTETVRVTGLEIVSNCYKLTTYDDRWNLIAGGTRTFNKVTTTLSIPYTIDDLKDEALDALSGFDGTWDDLVFSYYDRTGWTITLRETKAQVQHYPSATGHFTLKYRRRFLPKGGSDYEYEDMPLYTWAGGMPEPSKPYYDEANLIYADLPTLPIPEEEGRYDYDFQWWSCVPGYTPGEGDPNGFPPEEEE